MSGRRISLPKTASDYAAMAVAPLLIFLMISSLANFLMLTLYDGRFPGRLSWTLIWFTLGAVGIARLSIERDRTYSLAYGAVLGIATYLALLRFVDSPIFSLFVLAIIAYLADVIVRDCTLIDDDVDASGQGLIDSGHLFMRNKMKSHRSQPSPPQPSPPQPSSNAPAIQADSRKQQRKTHQPGRSVMYLALAALPLFGLGQFFLGNQSDLWTRARWLLAFYLFSSLSLLVTTSFLGLRRYLRQRNVEMPTDVSVGWLTGGLGIIALIMAIAYLAPLPGRAIASFESPRWLDSPRDTIASRLGWGDEGAEQSQEGDSTTSANQNAEENEPQGTRTEANAPPGDTGDGNRNEGPAGSRSGGPKNASDSKSAETKQPSESDRQNGSSQQDKSGDRQETRQSQQSSNDQQSSTKQDSQTPNQSQNQSSSNAAENNETKSDSGSPDSNSNPRKTPEPDEESPDSNQSSDSDQDPPPSDPTAQGDAETQTQNDAGRSSAAQSKSNPQSGSSTDSSSGSNLVGTVSRLFKVLIFLVLAAIVAMYVWLHRELVAAWWQSLFTSTSTTSEKPPEVEATVPSAPPRPFASFRNPIGNEPDLRKIIVITFQAFEAWTREQGTSRKRDETPAEFIQRAAKVDPRIAHPASQVVDAYNRIAYGRGGASRQDVQAAEKVWKLMKKSLTTSANGVAE